MKDRPLVRLRRGRRASASARGPASSTPSGDRVCRCRPPSLSAQWSSENSRRRRTRRGPEGTARDVASKEDDIYHPPRAEILCDRGTAINDTSDGGPDHRGLAKVIRPAPTLAFGADDFLSQFVSPIRTVEARVPPARVAIEGVLVARGRADLDRGVDTTD